MVHYVFRQVHSLSWLKFMSDGFVEAADNSHKF